MLLISLDLEFVPTGLGDGRKSPLDLYEDSALRRFFRVVTPARYVRRFDITHPRPSVRPSLDSPPHQKAVAFLVGSPPAKGSHDRGVIFFLRPGGTFAASRLNF